MIKQIQICGFKSLEDVTVDLAPITVLIGKSGSGKSNFMDAVRFLRDLLITRDFEVAAASHGGWPHCVPRTEHAFKNLRFRVRFEIEGFPDDLEYEFALSPQRSEHLKVGDRVLFSQRDGSWVTRPSVVAVPDAGPLLLGAITGLQESTLAYNALANGLGSYRFGDSVIKEVETPATKAAASGLRDDASNFVEVFATINRDAKHWQNTRSMTAVMRNLKPTLENITIDQPANQNIETAHQVKGMSPLRFQITQESEGFRRLFACLLALYQLPPKLTVMFDEPEKGIYPVGLSLLADEFKRFASKRGGQVILTTHSPEFLDHFDVDSMRIVEMKNYRTHIGLLSPEQKEALKEQFLKPSELLTADPARLSEPVGSAS